MPIRPSVQISSQDDPPQGIWDRFSRWQHATDKKIVEIVGTMGKDECFHFQLSGGCVATSPKSQEEMASSREWIPLAITPISNVREAAHLSNEEVVYLPVSKIDQIFDREHAKVAFNRIMDANSPFDLKILQIQGVFKLEWEVQAINRHLVATLKEKFAIPVDQGSLKRADQILEDNASIKFTFEQRQSLEDDRIGSSETIKGDARKRDCWREADAFIYGMAREKKPLSLEALCRLNALCVGDDQDNEVLGTGALRTEGVWTGGGEAGRLAYPPAEFVSPEVHQLLEDLASGIELCEQKGQNPLELAARMAQRCVSIHPFNDANGRTSGFIADYVLEYFGLPPLARGKETIPGIFGDQIGEIPKRTPTDAVEVICDALEHSYIILKENQ